MRYLRVITSRMFVVFLYYSDDWIISSNCVTDRYQNTELSFLLAKRPQPVFSQTNIAAVIITCTSVGIRSLVS